MNEETVMHHLLLQSLKLAHATDTIHAYMESL